MPKQNTEMSETPTAICMNIFLGLPTCEKGSDGHCYWKRICSCQTMLDNPGVLTKPAQLMYDIESSKAIDRSEETMRSFENYLDSMENNI